MKGNNITHSTIVKYWLDKMINYRGEVQTIKEVEGTDYLPVIIDWGEPNCWACYFPNNTVYERTTYLKRLEKDCTTVWNYQCVKGTLNKLHIKAFALSGDDSVSNLFLLCSKCYSIDGFDTSNLEKTKHFMKK